MAKTLAQLIRFEVVVCLFACLGACRSLQADPILVPPELGAGALYYLAFVTDGTIAAASNDIATYNAFVNAQAKLAGLGAIQWYAIVSTQADSAIDNLNLQARPPIYLLDGKTIVVEHAGLDLFDDGDLDNAIDEDQYANTRNVTVWTGSDAEGDIHNPLGEIPAETGSSFKTNSTWIQAGGNNNINQDFDIYAVSQLLEVLPAPTPVPEPSHMCLLGECTLGALAMFKLRGRKCPQRQARLCPSTH